MRFVATALFLLLLPTNLVSASLPSRAESGPFGRPVEAPVFVADELIVGWNDDWSGGASKAAAASAALAFGLEPLSSPALERLGATRFRVRGAGSPAAIAEKLAALPGVRYAEPNVVVYPAAIPTDPLYGGVNNVETDLQRWAFGGVGVNKVLNAEAAWDVTTGDPSVVIAVVDSGLDLDSGEFEHLWENDGERAGNSVDDDGNGYVDDVNGYDFHSRDGDINPDLGDGIDNDFNDAADDSASHGTTAASIIGAAHDGVGMAGAAPGCSLMTIKVFGDDGGVKTDVLIEAIEYAADNGADVLNLSLSTPFKSEALGIAVRYALERDVVVVAAAGNSNSLAPQYPASYSNVISVGGSGSGLVATSPGDTRRGTVNGRWPKSQFGLGAVDVVAPAVTLGASVVTVAQQNADPSLGLGATTYGIVEGTSFAAPFVSGLAGLVLSRDKELFGRRTLAPVDVKALLENTAFDLVADYSNHPGSGPAWDGRGRVDFAAALAGQPGAAEPKPVIRSGKHYQKKELRIFGTGFTADSQIEVNGTVLPYEVTFSYRDGLLSVSGNKQKLGLGKRRTNRIVVIDRGVRSAELVL